MENLCAKIKLQLSDFVHACRLAIFPEDRPSPVFPLLDVVLNGGLLVWSCSVICSAACEVTSRRWMVLGIVNAVVNMMFGILIMAVVRFRIYRGIALNVSEWNLFITEPVMLGYLAYLVWEIAWMVVATHSPLYALDDDCGKHLIVQVGFFVTYLIVGTLALVLSFATQVGRLPPWRQRAYTCWARRQQVLSESTMRNELVAAGQEYHTRHDLLSMTTTLNTTFSDEPTHREDAISTLSQFASSRPESPPRQGPSRPNTRPGPHNLAGREYDESANNNNSSTSMADSNSNTAGSFATHSPPLVLANDGHHREEPLPRSPERARGAPAMAPQQRRHAAVFAGSRGALESKPSCLASLAGSLCSDSAHSTPPRLATPSTTNKKAATANPAAMPRWSSVTTSPALERAQAHIDPARHVPDGVCGGSSSRGSKPPAEAVREGDGGPQVRETTRTMRETNGMSGASSIEGTPPREGPG